MTPRQRFIHALFAVAILAIFALACDVSVNLTAPCETVVQRDTTTAPGDTVYVITVSAERCPK